MRTNSAFIAAVSFLLVLGVITAAGGSTLVTPETATMSGQCTGTGWLAPANATETFTGPCSGPVTWDSTNSTAPANSTASSATTQFSTTEAPITSSTTSTVTATGPHTQAPTTTTSSSTTATSATSYGPGTKLYYAGATIRDVANTGVYGIIGVAQQPASAVGCVSYWVSDYSLSNTYWGQVGYYSCGGGPNVTFYQVWNIRAWLVVAGGIEDRATPAGSGNFSMYVSSGTTWAFALNGTVFGEVDLLASPSVPGTSEPILAMSEESAVAGPNAPVQVSFSSVSVRVGGSWSLAPHAAVFLSGSPRPWSVAPLAPGSFVVAGPTVGLNSGAALW